MKNTLHYELEDPNINENSEQVRFSIIVIDHQKDNEVAGTWQGDYLFESRNFLCELQMDELR